MHYKFTPSPFCGLPAGPLSTDRSSRQAFGESARAAGRIWDIHCRGGGRRRFRQRKGNRPVRRGLTVDIEVPSGPVRHVHSSDNDRNRRSCGDRCVGKLKGMALMVMPFTLVTLTVEGPPTGVRGCRGLISVRRETHPDGQSESLESDSSRSAGPSVRSVPAEVTMLPVSVTVFDTSRTAPPLPPAP
jgi:hypothetical protein